VRRVLLATVALALTAVLASPASAHPLGNFTTNRFSGIEIFEDSVVVHYVVDFAEIAAFQEINSIDSDGNRLVTAAELDGYAEGLGTLLLTGMELTADGDEVALDVVRAEAGLLDGQAGLDILRVEVDLEGSLPSSESTLEYADANYSSRIGWKEVIAYPSGGQGIVDSNVPSTSISDELSNYPKDRLSDPLQIVTADIEVAPGAGTPAPEEDVDEGPGASFDFFTESFTTLVDNELSPGFLVVATLLAIAFGALHALGPGHGKAVMAAYLVGTEARARHAVIVGVAVSIMHTASVVALGLITLWASSLFRPESVYPWLSLVSGVVVVGLGAWLLWTRLRADRAHPHSHPHDHDHDHHSSPLTWKGLTALALSGGLLPSPTALVVLLGAITLHRVAFGVLLVAGFSIGLAAALAALGLLVLKARGFAARHMEGRLGRLVPLLSAGVILTLGVVLTTRAAVSF
jgi:nickel/cobalt exporter